MSFGSIPPFFTSFPYGAVPSSGVASTKFVDLFNGQTVAGYKSWIVTHQTSTILPWGEWGVTKDAISRVIIEDTTSSNGVSAPSIRRVQSTTLSMFDVYQGTTDTGSNAIVNFRFRIGTGTNVATRPLATWQNNATTVISLSAAGALVVAGGSAPAVGVGTARWRSGTGTPEGAVTGNVGDLWSRTDGGASTCLYVKESGTGNTGWVAK